MPDVFGRDDLTWGDSFSADTTKVTFTSNGTDLVKTLLVQQLQYQYQQPINRIYELGFPKFYYVAGRCKGDGMIGSVLGPKQLAADFLSTFGNICKENHIHFTGISSCFSSHSSGYVLTYLILTSVGNAVRSEDMVINEQVTFMFNGLKVRTVDRVIATS